MTKNGKGKRRRRTDLVCLNTQLALVVWRRKTKLQSQNHKNIICLYIYSFHFYFTAHHLNLNVWKQARPKWRNLFILKNLKKKKQYLIRLLTERHENGEPNASKHYGYFRIDRWAYTFIFTQLRTQLYIIYLYRLFNCRNSIKITHGNILNCQIYVGRVSQLAGILKPLNFIFLCCTRTNLIQLTSNRFWICYRIEKPNRKYSSSFHLFRTNAHVTVPPSLLYAFTTL